MKSDLMKYDLIRLCVRAQPTSILKELRRGAPVQLQATLHQSLMTTNEMLNMVHQDQMTQVDFVPQINIRALDNHTLQIT